MSLIGLVVASVLFGVGTYLMLQRALSRVIIGLGLVSHGANLLIMVSGGFGGAHPSSRKASTRPRSPIRCLRQWCSPPSSSPSG